MTKTSTTLGQYKETSSDLACKTMASVLAVGDSDLWERTGQEKPSEQVLFLSFTDVNAALIETIQPMSIYSPVVAKSFDCIELAMTLHNIGYKGAYKALAADLPKPALIEREVRFICPKLDFEIITTN